MKTQVALRLEDDLIELARREAARQNRSLANYVEGVLAEALMQAGSEAPTLSAADADLEDAVAVGDDGMVDADETARLRHLIALQQTRGG